MVDDKQHSSLSVRIHQPHPQVTIEEVTPSTIPEEELRMASQLSYRQNIEASNKTNLSYKKAITEIM